MTKSDLDWQALGGALIGVGLALIGGLSMAWGGLHFQETVAKEVKKIRQQTQVLKMQLVVAQEEEEMITTHLPLYQRLIDQEIVGEVSQNRRMDWVDAVKTAAEQAKLPTMRYSITPTKVYPPLLPVQQEAMDIDATAMDLELELLHEGDLLNYFELLHHQGRGIFTVERCHIKPMNQGKSLNLKTPSVNAHCRILWQTIAKRPEATP